MPFPVTRPAKAEDLFAIVAFLNGVGASLPYRDTVDRRYIMEVRTKTGEIIHDE